MRVIWWSSFLLFIGVIESQACSWLFVPRDTSGLPAREVKTLSRVLETQESDSPRPAAVPDGIKSRAFPEGEFYAIRVPRAVKEPWGERWVYQMDAGERHGVPYSMSTAIVVFDPSQPGQRKWQIIDRRSHSGTVYSVVWSAENRDVVFLSSKDNPEALPMSLNSVTARTDILSIGRREVVATIPHAERGDIESRPAILRLSEKTRNISDGGIVWSQSGKYFATFELGVLYVYEVSGTFGTILAHQFSRGQIAELRETAGRSGGFRSEPILDFSRSVAASLELH